MRANPPADVRSDEASEIEEDRSLRNPARFQLIKAQHSQGCGPTES
jgi:hypothetical protein